MHRRLAPLYLCRRSRSVDPPSQAFRWITDYNINARRPIKSVYIIDKLETVVRIKEISSKMAEDRSSLKRSSHFLSIFSCLTPSPFCCFSFWEEVFQRFFYIVFLCKISWPHVTLPLGIMIWTNFHLCYPRVLLYKFQLFWQMIFRRFFLNVNQFCKNS